MPDQKRAFLDYTPTHVPLSILSDDYQPPEPDDVPSVSNMWEAATYRNWVGESLGRQKQAEEQGGVQEGYEVSLAELTEFNNKGYTDEELQFFAGATSPENFAYRQEQVKNDREAKDTLEKGGVTGFAVETASAIFDPAMIPLMLVGAPEAAATKFGTVGKIGWSMLRGGSEGVLSEYLLKMGDTQRTDEDLYMSAIGGMALSGLVDVGKMTYRGAKDALGRANAVEAVERAAVKEMDTHKGYKLADEVLSTEQPDPVARRNILSDKEIMDTLKSEAGERVEVMSKKKVKALKDEFRAYKKERLQVIDSIKARPNLRPTAKKAEIAQVEAAIEARQVELDSAVELNKTGLQQNANVDMLQQGKVPDSMQARFAELRAERGEFDTKPSQSLGKDVTAGRVNKPATETTEEEIAAQSVGAMRTRQQFSDIQTYDNLLTESDVEAVQAALSNAEDFANKIPRNTRFETSVLGKPLRSLSSEIDTAPDSATRGLGKMLVKDPQRTIEGHQSAEELADTLFHRAVPDYLDFQNAMKEYQKGLGISKYNLKELNKAEIEFERQTVMKQVSGTLLSNQPVDGDDAITLGAKARSRLYEQGLKNNKDYNVVGFDQIKHRHEYHSVVYDSTNIMNNAGNADNIYDAIAMAYQTGGIKLTRENALRLAKNQVSRAMAFGKSNKNFDNFMSDAEFKKLEEELISNNVSKDIIDDIKQSIFNKEEMGTISPRALFSLRPNLKARSGDVWLVDLLDTSINRNMKYVSDSAANAGLASNGFHSQHQFQRAVSAARDAAINDIRLDVKTLEGKAKAQAEKTLSDLESGRWANRLDEAMRLLYKEPLEDHDGLKDVTRMARKATSVVRLRSTGLMTVPEFAVAGIRNGIINTMKQIPSTRWFDYRSTSVSKDKFMKDFSRTFSATGHQEYLFGRQFYNGADFDDMTKNKLKSIDNKLGHALDITMTVNGFKMFQQGGEEMTARSIVSNLKDLAVRGEITSNIKNSLVRVGGMSEAQVDKMAKYLKDNQDLDIFDAVRHMDTETYNSLSTAVRNTIGSSFLRLGIGEQPAYMNKEMGKVMTTLLSFTIGSYEKMLLRGIKNERATLLAMGIGQAALGYMSLVANTYIQAQGLKGRERDKYIQRHLEDEGLFWGVMNRVGILAAPTLPLQALNSMNLLPESLKGAGNFSGIQSVEMAKDVAKATSAAMSLATENQSKRDQEKSWKTIQRVVPWYNSTMYNMASWALPD